MTDLKKATLAGGCFWGMEALFRKLPGVVDTEVGYCGDDARSANYSIVKTGVTRHAESVQITFDATIISYRQIIDFFFRIHDPSTPDRQGGDVGPQYRSTIFTHDEQQQADALDMIRRVETSGAWGPKLSTIVQSAPPFFPAESYHQDYLEKNPDGYTCHYIRKRPSFLT